MARPQNSRFLRFATAAYGRCSLASCLSEGGMKTAGRNPPAHDQGVGPLERWHNICRSSFGSRQADTHRRPILGGGFGGSRAGIDHPEVRPYFPAGQAASRTERVSNDRFILTARSPRPSRRGPSSSALLHQRPPPPRRHATPKQSDQQTTKNNIPSPRKREKRKEKSPIGEKKVES